MARRRRRDADLSKPVIQLIAIIFLACLIYPPLRQALSTLGIVLVGLLALVLIVWIAIAFYRRAGRESRAPDFSLNPFAPARVPSPIPETPRPAACPASPASQTTAEIIEQLCSIDWFQFEKIVELTYRKLGHAVTRRGGANPDGGIDLIIEKGGQRSAVQCKQWRTRDVGVRQVREFLGALTDAAIPKGVFITLSGYTGDAKHLADKHGIMMLNQTGLAELLEATDAKFDPEALAILRDTEKFCPKCENKLVIRTAIKGRNQGGKFWGCSTFPKCHFVLHV